MQTERGEVFADLLRDEPQEVDDVFGLARETLAELGILRGDAHRTGVAVALAHHHAAEADEDGGGEPEFLRAEQRGDDDVASGLQLAVHLELDLAAQAVQHERLLGFRHAEFPRESGVLDAGERGRARAAVVAGDQHHVGVRLGDARGDRADAELGDELHGDARLRIGVAEVVDELGEVLDGVDVVVRRRGDERDAGHGVADLRDEFVDLVAGQLAALAGLGSLRHLDLDVAGVPQVADRDAEPAAGDLLDGGIELGAEAFGVLAAFAAVAHRADRVHCLGDALVRLGAEGAEAHRA